MPAIMVWAESTLDIALWGKSKIAVICARLNNKLDIILNPRVFLKPKMTTIIAANFYACNKFIFQTKNITTFWNNINTNNPFFRYI